MSNESFQSKLTKIFDAGNAKLLGYVVHFQITDFELPFDDVRSALVVAGVDPDLIAPTREKGAFLRAVKATTQSAKTSRKNNTFRQRVAEDNKSAAMVIAKADAEVQGQSFDASFQTQTKILFNKEEKTLEVSGEHADEIKARFSALKAAYTGAQWRTAVLSYLNSTCKAVSVRRAGGVYFVPLGFQDSLAALIKVSEIIGDKNFDLTLIPIVDLTQARASIAKSGFDDLKSQLADFAKELDEAKSVSDRGFNARLSRYQDLKAKVETYEILLSVSAEEIHEQIKSLTDKLTKRLNEE